MPRIDSPVEDWDEEFLRHLIADELPEGLRLDYKQSVPISDAAEKAEACKDVSAFANTAGGRIIVGVAERRENHRPTGVPESLCALNDPTLPDRLMSVLQDGIMPRCVVIPHRIEAAGGGYYLALDIPPSHLGLHMVMRRGHKRYYYRTDDDSVPMDEAMVRAGYERFHRVADRLEQLYMLRRSPRRSGTNGNAGHLVIVPAFAPEYLFEASLDPKKLECTIDSPPPRWAGVSPVWGRSVGGHGYEDRPVVENPERPLRWTRLTFDG
ncbi:MAG: ATP-binding protein, partial [Gemmatimonadales bacterium]|nr:ATP-binding protein [Gemmatimonadales bacterium]